MCPIYSRQASGQVVIEKYTGGSRPEPGGGLAPPTHFLSRPPVFPPTTYYCDGRHNVCDIVWCRYTSLQVYIHVNIITASVHQRLDRHDQRLHGLCTSTKTSSWHLAEMDHKLSWPMLSSVAESTVYRQCDTVSRALQSAFPQPSKGRGPQQLNPRCRLTISV